MQAGPGVQLGAARLQGIGSNHKPYTLGCQRGAGQAQGNTGNTESRPCGSAIRTLQ